MTNQNIIAARKERLKIGLHTLANWCIARSLGDHDEDTTLTMLEQKVADLVDAVDRAGWRASNEKP